MGLSVTPLFLSTVFYGIYAEIQKHRYMVWFMKSLVVYKTMAKGWKWDWSVPFPMGLSVKSSGFRGFANKTLEATNFHVVQIKGAYAHARILR